MTLDEKPAVTCKAAASRKKTELTGVHSEIVSLKEKFVFLRKLEERNMYPPGPEGEKQGVSQKAKSTVPAGCAELNLMINFLMLIEKKFWLLNNK